MIFQVSKQVQSLGRMRALGVFFLFGISCLLGHPTSGTQPSTDPSPVVSPSLAPEALALPLSTAAPSPSPFPSPSPVAKLTPAAAKQLLREFTRAQATELKGLKHRHSLELQELRVSQKARQKEWKTKEADSRHKFFAVHKKGAERRAYITDSLERRKAFFQLLSEEEAQRLRDQDARFKAVRADQSTKLKEFQDFLGRGLIPPPRLWPESKY